MDAFGKSKQIYELNLGLVFGGRVLFRVYHMRTSRRGAIASVKVWHTLTLY